MPYQPRLLDALVRVKLGTQIKPDDVRDYARAIASLLDDEGVHQRLAGGPRALDRPGEV